jgi:hypothetical protein
LLSPASRRTEVNDVADWELAVAVVIVVLACAIDWALWRHSVHVRDRDLERLVREAALNHKDAEPRL